MTELIEMSETVVDVHGFELRPNDEIEVVIEEPPLKGRVVHITRPMGEMVQTEQGATTEQPPKLTVLLDDGREVVFVPEFLRLSMWRWNVLEVKRS